MLLKKIFDRVVSFFGLLFLWPVLAVVAVLIRIKMPGGPVQLTKKRVGKVCCRGKQDNSAWSEIAQVQIGRVAGVMECAYREYEFRRPEAGCPGICRQVARRRQASP